MKMYGKKLWSPVVVTTILHKILPSTSRYSQTKSSSIFTLSSCPILHHNTKYPTSDVLLRTPNVFPKRCFNSDDKIDVVKCWNCNVTAAKSPFLFCESCTSVQPVDQSADYFQIFGFVIVGKRKMYGKKLWSPVVTTILHKILPSMSRYSQTKSSSVFTLSSCPILHHTKYSTSDVLRRTPNVFPKRCFNSDSADKIDVIKCWNCNVTAAKSPFLFCESCTSVQPVDQSVDYFQIFGLKKMYVFDDKNLEGMYKDWQKKLHPDLVYSKSEQEKEYAAEQSARVIDAYRTLKKPLSRAIYILNLEGVVVDEEQTISDLDLLAEVMEIREAVEEAADSQTLKKIQSEILEKLKHSSESFANAFQRRNFEEAKSSIQRMTYYERVNEEIVKKL